MFIPISSTKVYVLLIRIRLVHMPFRLAYTMWGDLDKYMLICAYFGHDSSNMHITASSRWHVVVLYVVLITSCLGRRDRDILRTPASDQRYSLVNFVLYAMSPYFTELPSTPFRTFQQRGTMQQHAANILSKSRSFHSWTCYWNWFPQFAANSVNADIFFLITEAWLHIHAFHCFWMGLVSSELTYADTFVIVPLTNWGREKMAAISRRHFEIDFLEWNFMNFDYVWIEVCSYGPN